MDFNFTEEQTLLENMVTSFVRDNYPWEAREAIVKTEEGWKPENWTQFAELGLLGVPFAEEFGGLGGSVVDTMIVMEQFGKGLVVEPYMPSVILAGGLITSLGTKSQIDTIVPTIISGDVRYAFAHSEPQSRFDLFDVKTSAIENSDDFILNGFKSVVFAGPIATHLIISARTSGDQRDSDGITLFLVDKNAEGLTLQNYPTIDEYRASEVVIENLKISKDMVLGEVGKAYDAIDENVDNDIIKWVSKEEALEDPIQMIDFQTEYTKDLHSSSDYPAIDFELIRKHFKVWEHHKEEDIMTYRNNSFSSAVTGTVAPIHHTSWAEAMDDSMETFMKSK